MALTLQIVTQDHRHIEPRLSDELREMLVKELELGANMPAGETQILDLKLYFVVPNRQSADEEFEKHFWNIVRDQDRGLMTVQELAERLYALSREYINEYIS